MDFQEEGPAMISQLITSSTFVICGECGSTIYATDPESLVEVNQERILLRCRNNCCGHAAHYAAGDLLNSPQSRVTDLTNSIFLESWGIGSSGQRIIGSSETATGKVSVGTVVAW